jgi:zinc/manganese transport system permease protein
MFAPFMLNGWLLGTIVAVLAGALGLFVVLRGASFAAHALPLSTFPGAAAAALFGLPQLLGLTTFALLGVLGIAELGRRQRRDVATALTLVTMLGLGTLFLSLSGHYAQGVYALLFGQLVAVSRAELLPVGGMACATLLILGASFRPLLLSSIAPDLAAAQGASPRLLDLLFLTLLGLGTAICLPAVGALLVFSLMVGPPAAARRLTRRPGAALTLSVGFALLTVWSAIMLAYETDWPIGFFVGAIAAALFLMAEAAGRLRHAIFKERSPVTVQPG